MFSSYPTYSHVDAKRVPLDHKLLTLFTQLGLDPRGYKGVYIEAGANNGLMQSNTALLEKSFGWTGVLVEPSPKGIEECRRNRATSNVFVHSALISFDTAAQHVTSIEGDFASGDCMSSIGGRRTRNPHLITVPARTLQSILDEHDIASVDLLSLDTEGYEMDVLKGIDFEAPSAPKVCLIELYTKDVEAVCAMLSEWYECRGNFSNYNHNDNPGWDGTHNDYLFVQKSLTTGKK